jgi:hypothetical protein
MPYGHAAQSSVADLLYASNIRVGGGAVSESAQSPGNVSSGSGLLPFGGERAAGYRMKAAFAVGDRAYVDGPATSGVVTSLPDVLAHRPELVAVLTRDKDKGVGCDVEDWLTFRVSCDADVYVCYDAHAQKPAPWLKLAGFRGTSSRVRTSDGVYALHHRFYAKARVHCWVRRRRASCLLRSTRPCARREEGGGERGGASAQLPVPWL